MQSIPDVRPRDVHNELLVSNVHPPNWKNPEPAPAYNLVVVGAGTAGLITSAIAAGLGARVALVERHFLGGDCLNVGCVPSKAVIRASRMVVEARSAAKLGLDLAPDAQLDFGAAMERMRRLRAQISHADSVARYTNELGVDVFLGEARFGGARAVEVNGASLRFKKAVLATGARPWAPPIEGLSAAGFLTNETVFSLTERPRRLAVIGGGPIGCELAQAFGRHGSRVTLLEREAQFLSREDPDAAKILLGTLEREGIDVRLDTEIERVERSGTEKRLHLNRRGARDVVVADEILVGAGRVPNIEGLNLEAVGVEHDAKRGVRVNDYLQTSNPRIFAAGDVCMNWKFTHAADAAAKIVVQNSLFFKSKKLSALVMPWCTYTDPEIAHVGMYERDARERGIELDTFKVPLHEIDRAVVDGEEDGFVKIHVEKGTDRILGGTIVAAHAGELISQLSMAIVGKVGLRTIGETIFPYPTQAEGIKRVAGAYTRTRLTPFVARLFARWLAWTR